MAETPQPQKPPSQSSRLRLLKPQEQDAAKEAEAYPAYRKSPPPEGLAESEQEEASFPQHPPAGQTLQEQAFVRPPPGAKTSVMQGKLINRPPQSEETIENYKEQLQNYLELCDSLSDAGWTPDSIIDVFYVMIQSLDLDTVALALLDFSTGNSFMPVAARGFKNFPGDNIVGIWNQAVGEGPSVDWNKLMVIASGKQGDLSKWISIEGLDSIGYVPIHDSRTIFGFIFIGTHDKSKPQSGIASSLLELCGSRMGLVVALRRLQGTWN